MRPGLDHIGVTISFLCHDGRGNWLLHKRSENCRDEQGKWDFGGGTLEFGETLEEGVLRELREEFGCDGTINEQLGAINKLRTNSAGQDTHWVGIPFIIQISPLEVRNNEPDKVETFDWFTLNELPQPLHSATQNELPLLLPYLKKYS